MSAPARDPSVTIVFVAQRRRTHLGSAIHRKLGRFSFLPQSGAAHVELCTTSVSRSRPFGCGFHP